MTPCIHSPSCDLENTACRTVAACQRSRVTDEQPEVPDSQSIFDSAKVGAAKEGRARGEQLQVH